MGTSPTLVHIGYHKTGTTWLQRVLFSSSEIGFTSPFSEQFILSQLCGAHALDFRPDSIQEKVDSALSAAHDFGLVPVVSAERLSGNPHSGGHDSKEMSDRLSELFPRARILIVIREQSSIVHSTYRQYVRAGGALPLARYLEGAKDFRIPRFDFAHFRFDRLIRYYIESFGRRSILVLPYELFAESPACFVDRICAFSGVDSDSRSNLPFGRKEYASACSAATSVTRVLNQLFGAKNSLNRSALFEAPESRKRWAERARTLDRFRNSWWNQALARRNRRLIVDMIGSTYAESNLRTAALTGLDLARFGYLVEPGRASSP